MRLLGSQNFGSLHVETYASGQDESVTLYQFRNQTGRTSLCTESELRKVRDHLNSLLSKTDHAKEAQITKPVTTPPRARQRSRG